MALVRLDGPAVTVVVDASGGVPFVVHWGAALPDGADLEATARALARAVPFGGLDVEAPCSLVPEGGRGYPGHPGLRGSRAGGAGWAPCFEPAGASAGERSLRTEGVDPQAGLRLVTDLVLDEAGVLHARARLVNEGATSYALDELVLALPLPDHADELLTFTGRWCRELQPVRQPWAAGVVGSENRRGRTSHDHQPAVFAGPHGFGEWHGEVWGAHLAWSGNHQLRAERLADGRRVVQLGELLHPGEVVLAPGEGYDTPELLAVYSPAGLTLASQAFHRSLRARPDHPRPDRPRPVLLNTWEAVYFDHDVERLCRLADAAAALGVERFVLDDGWFHGRRHDRAGLGDWWVDPDVWPQGLHPLVDHVRGLGMEFGLWVEPEMVNPDSDLYRAHPEWTLVTPGYEPVLGRHQLVLDLANPEAWEHVLARLDALLSEYAIAYLKWDMNRDHVQASHDGRAGTHAQTLAVYALMDELTRRHPHVEIESCASGGGRADAEILRRTVRIWTSDCNDALERQSIQRGFSMLFPPEVMGAHIGPPRAHTTGRRHSLAFRAATALFGHLGIEWNVLDASDADRAALAEVIAVHKRFRPLLHGGDTVRFDRPDPAALAHGVYAADRSEALVAYVQLTTSSASVPSALRLPGLDPERRYAVRRLSLPREDGFLESRDPSWLDGVELTGAQLAAHGLALPVLLPESVLLLHLAAG